jgi:predicted nucleic acid-binding protein
MNLNKVGTVGLLLKGKQAGFLPEIGPHLEVLRRRGFSLSQTVIESALRQANE